jgi:hypothetical protein
MDPPPSPETIPRPVIGVEEVNNHNQIEVTQDLETTLNPSHPSPTIDDLYGSDCDDVTDVITNNCTQDSSTNMLQDKYVRLYHENKSYMVLKQYCLHTSIVDASLCKFPFRKCIVKRSKVLDSGTQLSDISPTVYKPDPKENKKISYTRLDTRYVYCYLRNCEDPTTKTPKVFHFSCHVHNQQLNNEEGFKLLEYKRGDTVLLDQIKNNDEELKQRIMDFPVMNTKLVFPLCSKRCFNSLENQRTKAKEPAVKKPVEVAKKKDKNSGTPALWDKDGTENNKSSIRILIDWLTTEGNLSDYYGGGDKNGYTNSNRKETYHNYLSNKIKAENGAYYMYKYE